MNAKEALEASEKGKLLAVDDLYNRRVMPQINLYAKQGYREIEVPITDFAAAVVKAVINRLKTEGYTAHNDNWTRKLIISW
tara:strand:- start:2349 stop:2591 length:243 start_codon:yes stop_codon:yes gene_type:complete